MKKNDIVTVDITDMTEQGSGVGRYENTVIFTPLTAVGDKVSVRILKDKKTYAFGKIEEIIEPSKDRITSDCECFSRCGGCSYRHISYESELSIKEKRVYDCIKRIGKIDMEPKKIVSDKNVYRYRNKAQFPVGKNGEIGFYSLNSHRIISCDDCLLQPCEFKLASDVFKKWMAKYNISAYDSETKIGLIRHLYIRKSFSKNELMVVLVINGDKVNHTDELVKGLRGALGDNLKSVQLNVNRNDNNVVLGYENILLFGRNYIEDSICGIDVRISPNSFFQVNRNMAEMLYDKAKEYAKPKDKTILDLYCGTGTIGLTMAKEAKKVIGVEIIEDAIVDAKINAQNNGIENSEFICGDALKAADELNKRGLKPDIVILDPPRKGCTSELIDIVSNGFSPERVVYVSCDPSTLARDIKTFGEYGYIVAEYTPFDLFPRTPHVETVAYLIKNIT